MAYSIDAPKARFATRLAGVALLGLLAGCLPQKAQYEGVAPQKRNIVEVSHFSHDIAWGANNRLDDGERAKLIDFLVRSGVGYGDEISLDDPNDAGLSERRDALRAALAGYGFRLVDGATMIGLAPGPGTTRLVVTRHMVTPPGCPDWSDNGQNNWQNAPSTNFGCADATNLGAMIANPRDLNDGQTYAGASAERSTTAVDHYNRATPTGYSSSGGGSSLGSTSSPSTNGGSGGGSSGGSN